MPQTKIVIGMPLYGRAFAATEGLGKPFHGTGEGSWEQGVWDYKVLPREGAKEVVDERVGASWSYDKGSKVLVSYDSVGVARLKADWVRREQLGGVMWWETSGDRVGEGSLIAATVDRLGGQRQREGRENRLEYPMSKYENMRKGFPGE